MIRDENNVFHEKLIVFKMNENENRDKKHQKYVRKLAKSSIRRTFLGIYPHTLTFQIKEKIAFQENLTSSNVLIGNGAEQVLELIMKTFINKGYHVVSHYPTYIMYDKIAEIYNTKIEYIESVSEKFNINTNEIIKKIHEKSRSLLIICQPNNPTGTVISDKDLINILNNCRDSIVLIDQAYAAYHKSYSLLTKQYENLIVVNSFSKTYGVPGIRLGYLCANKVIVDEVDLNTLPTHVNAISINLAIKLLKNSRNTFKMIERLKKYTKIIMKELSKIPFIKVYPSVTNFFLIKVTTSEIDLETFLILKGILIKKICINNDIYYRVSIVNKKAGYSLLNHISNFEVKS